MDVQKDFAYDPDGNKVYAILVDEQEVNLLREYLLNIYSSAAAGKMVAELVDKLNEATQDE